MIIDTKPVFLSVTTWALIVGMICGLLSKWGYVISDELQGKIVELIMGIIAVISGIVAFWGRWRAERPLSLSGGPATITKKSDSLISP